MEKSVHKTLDKRGGEKPLSRQRQPGTLPLEMWPLQPQERGMSLASHCAKRLEFLAV